MASIKIGGSNGEDGLTYIGSVGEVWIGKGNQLRKSDGSTPGGIVISGGSAFDGQYSSLTGKPAIPTDVSNLTDTTSLLTSATSFDITNYAGHDPNASNFGNAYANFTTLEQAIGGLDALSFAIMKQTVIDAGVELVNSYTAADTAILAAAEADAITKSLAAQTTATADSVTYTTNAIATISQSTVTLPTFTTEQINISSDVNNPTDFDPNVYSAFFVWGNFNVSRKFNLLDGSYDGQVVRIHPQRAGGSNLVGTMKMFDAFTGTVVQSNTSQSGGTFVWNGSCWFRTALVA
jgi:hypothetical protein